jgi:uncharacterized protein (TIGR00730 family)
MEKDKNVEPKKQYRSKIDLVSSILKTMSVVASEDPDLLDLKMIDAVLAEMSEAFRTFRPYRDRKKVTMFGSARTDENEPLYRLAKTFASIMSENGWMVITGAGPGIMSAGIEGAGAENALGVNIRLPFEQQPNVFLAHDPKLVQMKYFFTRKLMLIKESDAYVILPGGFGTQDEGFELLTLVQTGKALPAPIILLDVGGDDYWDSWFEFVKRVIESRSYTSPDDTKLFIKTDSPSEAVKYILKFYSNYHSIRWVGSNLIIRLKETPSASDLKKLSNEFSDILIDGRIEMVEPTKFEILDKDVLDLKRLKIRFTKHNYGRLTELIWRLNGVDSLFDSSD